MNSRLIERWLPAGLKHLLKTDLYDEAVSEGLLPVLRGRAERVSGIDVSPRIVAEARSRHPELEATVADVRALPFAPDSFDAVFSNSTLDHLPDESQFVFSLAELARVLRPGGHLVITLDNPVNPLLAFRNRAPRWAQRRLRQDFPYDAGWTCGPRRLRELLARQGLGVREETAILHAPRAIVARVDTPSPETKRRILRLIASAESLGRLPTRYLSGHFIAAHSVATAPPEGPE